MIGRKSGSMVEQSTWDEKEREMEGEKKSALLALQSPLFSIGLSYFVGYTSLVASSHPRLLTKGRPYDMRIK